jgi:hypothetical protein
VRTPCAASRPGCRARSAEFSTAELNPFLLKLSRDDIREHEQLWRHVAEQDGGDLDALLLQIRVAVIQVLNAAVAPLLHGKRARLREEADRASRAGRCAEGFIDLSAPTRKTGVAAMVRSLKGVLTCKEVLWKDAMATSYCKVCGACPQHTQRC